MFRKIGLLFPLLLVTHFAFAQRFRERYNGPLPDIDEAGEYLLIGLILIFIGWLIVKSINSDKNIGVTIGCLGQLMIGAGLFCMLPILLYIERVVNSIIGIVFIGIIILVVVVLIWNWLTGDKEKTNENK